MERETSEIGLKNIELLDLAKHRVLAKIEFYFYLKLWIYQLVFLAWATSILRVRDIYHEGFPEIS